MEQLTLIGRYYDRLENKSYADILELKINSFEDLSQCNFSYLNDNIFYDITYENLIKIVYMNADIHSHSLLRSNSAIIFINSAIINNSSELYSNAYNKLYRSFILNNSSLLENNIINRKASIVNVTNNSSSKAKSLKIKRTNANIRCVNSFNFVINNRLYIKSDIHNTSNISSYTYIYTKRVKRKYFTLEISKSHVIEVIL